MQDLEYASYFKTNYTIWRPRTKAKKTIEDLSKDYSARKGSKKIAVNLRHEKGMQENFYLWRRPVRKNVNGFLPIRDFLKTLKKLKSC